tara:strand:+ start:1233 stop:1793 length:561 start_codon:yes stop_codon:yes gene_type:complete
MKVLIKAMRPHRQKVLTEDGQEMRLQQWANKTASAALRTAGGEASGEQFTQARDALMREAVANPDEHGLKFMGERMPFEGQTLEESLSEPDIFDEQGNLRQTLPQEEKKEFEPDAEAEHLRRIMTSRDVAIRDAWTVLKQQKGFPYRDVRQDMVAEEYRKREAEKQLDDLRRRMTEPRTGPAAGNA